MLKKFKKKNSEERIEENVSPGVTEIVPDEIGIVTEENVKNADEIGEISIPDTYVDNGEFAIEAKEDASSEDAEVSSKEAENSDEIEDPFGETSSYMNEVRAFALGRGIPEDKMQAGVKMLQEIGRTLAAGIPTVRAFEIVAQGMDFERAVDQAYADGELAGRNARIEMEYMGDAGSDGLPHLASTGGAGKKQNRMSSIFDLAREA